MRTPKQEQGRTNGKRRLICGVAAGTAVAVVLAGGCSSSPIVSGATPLGNINCDNSSSSVNTGEVFKLVGDHGPWHLPFQTSAAERVLDVKEATDKKGNAIVEVSVDGGQFSPVTPGQLVTSWPNAQEKAMLFFGVPDQNSQRYVPGVLGFAEICTDAGNPLNTDIGYPAGQQPWGEVAPTPAKTK